MFVDIEDKQRYTKLCNFVEENFTDLSVSAKSGDYHEVEICFTLTNEQQLVFKTQNIHCAEAFVIGYYTALLKEETYNE